MPSAVIGALRVDLTLGTAGWTSGLDKAARDAQGAAGKFKAVGGTITAIGAGLTAGITAPLVGIGAAAIKTAANYETAMIKLRIATQATGQQMKEMSDLALQLGKSTVFSASEAAGAMEELAKNGVSVQNILGGAAKAAVDLAAAAGSELEPAAVAVSDAMNQFHLSAKDLPKLVNQITGAVNESKLDFADFQLGMAQAGGVAGGLGVTFEDFNAVLAGTSSMFASGSDAGTSFKTFLTTFVPKSKQAAEAMKQYGLSFFDASGRMKSMSDIAQMLQDKLGGLSQKAKNDVLSTIFGTDAMRTAVGLMNLGSKGLDDIAAKIAKTDAAAQSAERMKGLNAQLEQLGGTLETLAIRVGETGLLTSVTSVIRGITDMLDKLTEMSPAAAQFAVGAAAVAAAIGPIMLVVGPLVSGIGSLIAQFGVWQGALSAASVAAGGFVPLIAPMIPVLIVAAAAVAGVWQAWQHWDTIGPILSNWASGVVDRVGEAARWIGDLVGKLDSADARMSKAPKTTWLDGFTSRVAQAIKDGDGWLQSVDRWTKETDKAFGVPSKGDFFDWIGSELKGLYTDVDNALRAVDNWAKGVDASAIAAWKSFEQMHARVQAAFNGMVDGIVEATTGKLRASLSWVEEKARAVGDAFYTLYDRVVGHSYIPDMVDGIAAEMSRLDGEMVDKVKAATDASGQSMKGLSDKAQDAAKEHAKAAKATATAWKALHAELAPLLDRLFPEAKALKEFEADMRSIGKAEKGGYLSKDQADEARKRRTFGADYADKENGLNVQGNGMMSEWGAIDISKVDMSYWTTYLDTFKAEIPDLATTAKRTAAETVEAFAGMARDSVSALRGMVQSFRSGDILGGLSGVLDIVTQVAGLIRGNSTPRQSVNVTGGMPYGGGRALGGPVVPGKRYRVGERGPEWLEVGAPGRITPDAAGGGRGGNVYHISGNLLTPEFWAQINAGHDAAAIRGATGGAQLANDQAAYSRQRYLG